MYEHRQFNAPERANSGYNNPVNNQRQPMQTGPANHGFNNQPHPNGAARQQPGKQLVRAMNNETQPNARQQAPANYAGEKPKAERPEWWLQINSYGSKCAFQVENSSTKDGWFTVNIESAARENPNDQSNKRYLWNQKTVLQMTRSELPIFCAVMLGMLPNARFDLHGSDAKFFEVVNQGKNLYFKTGGQGKNLHVAPVPITDAFMFGTMALTQYARNFNGLTTDSALEVISRMASQLFSQGAYKQAQERK